MQGNPWMPESPHASFKSDDILRAHLSQRETILNSLRSCVRELYFSKNPQRFRVKHIHFNE